MTSKPRAACDRALTIIETLDRQLAAEEMQATFLNSALVREIKPRRDSL